MFVIEKPSQTRPRGILIRAVCPFQIIVETYNSGSPTPEFNNAGQVFNHDFYWESISPSPSAALRLLRLHLHTDGVRIKISHAWF